MNKEETIEAIKVMQAYVDGEDIVAKLLFLPDDTLEDTENPIWNWSRLTYEVKPKPKTVPKKITWKRLKKFYRKYKDHPKANFKDSPEAPNCHCILTCLSACGSFRSKNGSWWDYCEIIDERWPQKEVSE